MSSAHVGCVTGMSGEYVVHWYTDLIHQVSAYHLYELANLYHCCYNDMCTFHILINLISLFLL